MKTWLILLGTMTGAALLGLPVWTAALNGGEPFSPENLVTH